MSFGLLLPQNTASLDHVSFLPPSPSLSLFAESATSSDSHFSSNPALSSTPELSPALPFRSFKPMEEYEFGSLHSPHLPSDYTHTNTSNSHQHSRPGSTTSFHHSFSEVDFVRNLTESELLVNPHFQRMYTTSVHAKDKEIQAKEREIKLYERLDRLSSQLISIQAQLGIPAVSDQINGSSSMQFTPNAIATRHAPGPTFSKSLSKIPPPHSNYYNGPVPPDLPLNRYPTRPTSDGCGSTIPAYFPPSVLFHDKDSLDDRHVISSSQTPSKCSLAIILRTEDGKPIGKPAAKAVEISGRVVARRLFSLLNIPNRKPTTSISKSYFKENFCDHWDGACRLLEDQQEVLRICDNTHWKAERVLSYVLNNIKKGVREQYTEPRAEKRKASPENDEQPAPQSKKSRPGPNATTTPATSTVPAPASTTSAPSLTPPNTPTVFPDVSTVSGPIAAIIRLLALVKFKDYPNLQSFVEFVNRLDQHIDLSTGLPSADFEAYVSRIEMTTDSAEFEDEEREEGWGHHQFSNGSLSPQSVLVGWNSIGSVKQVLRLIQCTLETCLAARDQCRAAGKQINSFVADSFAQNIFELLEKAWSERPLENSQTATSNDTGSDCHPTLFARNSLMRLKNPLLKQVLKKLDALNPKLKNKSEFVQAILNATPNASEEALTEVRKVMEQAGTTIGQQANE